MTNKKIIVSIIIIIVIAIASVCFWIVSSNSNKSKTETNNNSNKNVNEHNNQDEENNNESTENSQSSGNDIAIIYFSKTGTTETVADYIQHVTGGDLIEIIPKDEYTDADLNYNNSNSRATKEQNDSSVRPEIANTINTDFYDVIFLGYPIWFGDAPRIILTFLDNHDLSEKTVIPFCTSGSTQISTSVNYFKNHYKDINWLDGKRLTTSESEVSNWVNSLNY